MRHLGLAVYQVLARALLPQAFHEEYGVELAHVVGARLAASGKIGVAWVLAREVADLSRTAAREWWKEADVDVNRLDRRGGGMLEGFSDLRTGARNLMRRPGLALGATLTIALGIGATTSIYSVVDGVVLRPLPYEDPGTLVAVGALAPGSNGVDPESGLQELGTMSSLDVDALRERARSFESIAGIAPYRILVAEENGSEQVVGGARVSEEYFGILGVAPTLGRLFLGDEFVPGESSAVVISHSFWQTRYGGDPNVLGTTFEWWSPGEGGRPTVVGVLPRDYRPPEAFFQERDLPEFYAPMAVASRDMHVVALGLSVLGRLSRGTTVDQARAEVQALATELAAETPAMGSLPGGRARALGVNSLQAETIGGAGRTLWAFLGAAGLLLLLTVMNAATLLLARGLDRRQELGVRVALGAQRAGVVRLLLGEAGILATVGGALGVLLAYGGVESFLRFAPRSIPRLDTVAVDARVLLAAVLATVATGVGAGLLPALGLTRRHAWEGLQAGGRTTSEPASRLRAVLVGGQLALAMVLLSSAGLLFTSFVRLRAADPGFDPEGIVALTAAPTGPVRISIGQAASFYQRWDPVLAAEGAVGGVTSVAGASGIPFQAPNWAPSITLAGDAPGAAREGIAGYVVTPGFFETMGIDVLRGRTIGTEDGPDAERVAVVNEAFARTQLSDGEGVGELVNRATSGIGTSGTASMRIVGVVEDVVQARAEDGPHPAIYIPYTQADIPQLAQWWTVARTNREAAVVLPEIRSALQAADVRPENATSMGERIALTQITPRFQTLLIGTFAGVALLLAAAGLHGSLAHTVRRRQRELGVRMALGADRGSVLRMVLGQGLRTAAAGLVLGLAGTVAGSRVLAAFLYGVTPYDPLTLAGVAAILIVVSAIACLSPARRATAVDPVRVLQAE